MSHGILFHTLKRPWRKVPVALVVPLMRVVQIVVRILHVTKDNWVTAFKSDAWEHLDFPLFKSGKNNIYQVPERNSYAKVTIAIQIWKFRPVQKHQMALMEWGIHLVLPFRVLSTVSVCGTARKQQTLSAGCCLSNCCDLPSCRGTDTSLPNCPRLIRRIWDFPPASQLWEPVWGVSHSVTRALW